MRAGTCSSKRVIQATTLWRRHIITQLYLAGHKTQQEIVRIMFEEYGHQITQPVVSNDLKLMKEQWLDQSGKSVEEWLTCEIAKLDMQEVEIRFKMDSVVEKSGPKGALIEEPELTAAEGHSLLLKIADRRSKLLGLDRPKKIEVEANHHGIPQHMTDEQIEEALQRVAAASAKYESSGEEDEPS